MLRIHNGGDDGQYCSVTSGVIRLNGKRVVKPREFKKKVLVIEKRVRLRRKNLLAVKLGGKPGCGITLEIVPAWNAVPVADAGADQDVTVGAECTLDGSNSYDPDGDLIAYSWTIMSKPAGSGSELDDPSSVTPSFIPDISGAYEIALTVNDGHQDSAPDEVVVTAFPPNAPPTARAGPDQSVTTGSVVHLDGTGSFDPEADPLTYSWEILSVPQDSDTYIDDPTSPTPSFLADVDGEYTLSLIVNDGEFDSLPDEVVITSATPNAEPVADAGEDQVVLLNSSIMLDGTESYDPDQDSITYSWTIVSRPRESVSELDDPSLPTPQILADKAGDFVFRLVVNDGELDSDPDTVVVICVIPPTPPAIDPVESPTSQPSQVIWGQADPSVTIAVTGGMETVQAETDGEGEFSLEVSLNQNTTNHLSFTATDQYGFTSESTSVEIIHDSIPPPAPDTGSITVSGPGESGMVQVAGEAGAVEPGSFVTVQNTNTNGTVTVQANSSGAFLVSIEASPGDILEIHTRDSAGNSSSPVQTMVPETPPITSTTGYVHGRVFDSRTDQPLALAEISARDVQGKVYSDPHGKFVFPAPDTGRYLLTIEKQGYTYAQRWADVVATQDVHVKAAYLTPLDSAVSSIGPEGGTHNSSAGDIIVTIPPGAVDHEIEVSATMLQADRELPSPLPMNSIFTYAMEFQPHGATFAEPVQVRFTNSLGFAPGTPIPVGYFDRTAGKWIDQGMAQVSSDGNWVDYTVTHFSAYDINLALGAIFGTLPLGSLNDLPGKSRGVHNEAKGKNEFSFSYKSGDLTTSYSFPTHISMGSANHLTFVYHSTTAKPRVVISLDHQRYTDQAPSRLDFELNVAGLTRRVTFNSPAQDTPYRFAYLFDARNARGEQLPTGLYPYQAYITHIYPGNYYTAEYFGGPPVQDTGIPAREGVPRTIGYGGTALVLNQSESPFGVGWGLAGLKRLHVDPAGGRALLTDGSGTAAEFSTKQVLGNIEWLFAVDVAVDQGGTAWVSRYNFNTLASDPGEYGLDSFSPSREHSGCFSSCALFPGQPCVGWQPRQILFDGQDRMIMAAGSGTNSAIVLKTASPCDRWSEEVLAAYPDVEDPIGLAMDSGGNVYATCWSHDSAWISKILPDKTVIKLFDGQIDWPFFLATDPDDNLYISSLTTGIIYRMTPDLHFSEYASGFMRPTGVACDQEGNLYVAESVGGTIYRVAPEGTRTIVATGLMEPMGLAFDPEGNLYVADHNRRGKGVSDGYLYKITLKDDALYSDDGLSILVKNPDNSYSLTLPEGSRMEFDPGGLQTAFTDTNGNTTTFAYDGQGRLVSITDPVGKVTTLQYAGDHLSQVTDPAGRATRFSVDANGDLVSITDAMGYVTAYTYNDHLMTSETNVRGKRTTYTYDANGFLSRVVEPLGVEHNLLPSDSMGLVNDIPSGQGTPDSPASLVPAEDVYARYTDPRGNETDITLDGQGRIVKVVDPMGNVTTVSRDQDSRPVWIELPDYNLKYHYRYDGRGNLTYIYAYSSIGNSGYDRDIFTWDPRFDRIKTIKDPVGMATGTYRFDYDDHGNLVTFTDAAGNVTTYTYNSRGQVETVTAADGGVTSFSYDAAGNLVSITDALGRVTSLARDTVGRVIGITDGEGNSGQIEYNRLGWPTQITDALGNIASVTYDPEGNPISTTDTRGNKWTTQYDDLGRPVRRTTPLGYTATVTYDASGNVTSITDYRGETTTFTYDTLNRLVQKDAGGKTTTYTYDNLGVLTEVSNADDTVTYRYGVYGISGLVPVSEQTNQGKVTYTWTGFDVLTRVTSHGFSLATIVEHSYDPMRRPTRIVHYQSGTNGVYSLEYDEMSRVRSRVLYGKPTWMTGGFWSNSYLMTTTFDYDDVGNLLSLSDTLGIQALDFTYDGVDNVLTKADTTGTSSYSYDSLYRLIQAIHPASATETYTYDSEGNRLTDALGAGYTYDAANRLLSMNGTTFTYDGNGNMTSKTDASGTTTYTWDAEDQLVRIDFPDGTFAAYKYDPLGRRIEKDVNGIITRYLYSGRDLVEEYDVNGTCQAAYAYEGLDRLIFQRRGDEFYYYQQDELGNVVAVTDKHGNVLNTYNYDTFGNIISKTETIPNPFTFTGREYDPESGLYYLRNRYYDPRSGRFLSVDPLDESAYSYVENNPLYFTDPLGLSTTRGGYLDASGRSFLGAGARLRTKEEQRRVIRKLKADPRWPKPSQLFNPVEETIMSSNINPWYKIALVLLYRSRTKAEEFRFWLMKVRYHEQGIPPELKGKPQEYRRFKRWWLKTYPKEAFPKRFATPLGEQFRSTYNPRK